MTIGWRSARICTGSNTAGQSGCLFAALSKEGFGKFASLPSKTISRVLICFHEGAIFALHGFIKKTQTTPTADLEIARKRMKEVEDDK